MPNERRPTRTSGATDRRPAPARPVVFTIGYAGRSLDSFVDALHGAGVERIVDVRALPLSRRKGFSKSPLREALESAGIEYVHLRLAGNPYRDKRNNIERCLALYSRHVQHHPDVVAAVAGAIDGKVSALLCVEASANECHRSILADRLRRRGRDIRHL